MREITGVRLSNGSSGRELLFGPEAGEQGIVEALTALMNDGLDFSVYDALYPSPSDPGAYFSYRPERGVWRMTLGNHGWSGGIYEIEAAVVAQQLAHLHRLGLLESLGLDRVCFFSHYAPLSVPEHRQMNQRMREIHD
jgi:hypothetical protein